MPIYAYKCDSCGFAKDVLQKMSAPLLSDCPVCGASTFKKQLTAAGFQLKGSGWYATDFKGAAATAPAASTETASVVADGAKPAASPVTKSDAATAPAAGSGGACGSACACH